MRDFEIEPAAAPGAALPRQPGRRLRHLWARARRVVPFAAGVLATLVALLLLNVLVPRTPALTMRQVDESVARALASATPLPAFSARVYQVIQPSLVFIQARAEGEGENGQKVGSGVVVNEAGDILTSLHVVDNSVEIEVGFADGSVSSAQVIASEPENDIAVLRAHRPPALIVPAILASSRGMRVGDEAFAVGNPFGLYSSMSAGVISGFERSFRPPDSGQRLEGLIQIDAAVNPGNSGGPLLNRHGQVVGIVVGIVNPTDQEFFIGVGFAVPIEVAGGAAGMPPH